MAASDQGFGRRSFLTLAIAAAVSSAAPISSHRAAFAAEETEVALADAAATGAPIAVFGADGETGVRVVDILVSKGVPVRSIYHFEKPEKPRPAFIRGIPVQHAVAHVEDEVEVGNAVKGAKAVICVVGTRPKKTFGVGSDFEQTVVIDGDEEAEQMLTYTMGYSDLAKECIKNKVPNLVIMDSACTHTSSTCESMARGEEALRDLYAKAPPGLGYSIVRAGQLYNGEERGPAEIEVNQGGDKTGVISRQDMAQLLVEVAMNEQDSKGKRTFEAYYTDTAQPKDMRRSLDLCEENGISMKECFFGKGIKSGKGKDVDLKDVFASAEKHSTVFPTGREHHSNGGWKSLLAGLQNDVEKVIDITEFGAGSG